MPYSKLSPMWMKVELSATLQEQKDVPDLVFPVKHDQRVPLLWKPKSNKDQGKQKASNCAIFTVRAAVGGKSSWSASYTSGL